MAQQLFYVLSGEALFDVDGEQVIVKAGESLHIKSMVIHKMSNAGLEQISFIVISEPKSQDDRVNVMMTKINK